jgi:hypothetical protein
VTEVTDLSGPESDLFRTFIITSTYTGTQLVTEQYFIVTYDGHRWLVGSRELTPTEAANPRTFRILVADLPNGWRYFDVVANVVDAPGPARFHLQPISPYDLDAGAPYIILS